MSRTFCASVVIFLLSFSSFAQRAGYEVGTTIQVRNFQGQPVRDARVDVRDSNGRSIFSGYTNPLGVLEVRNVPAGNFEVVAVAGVNEVRERVEFGGGGVLNLRLGAEVDPNVGGKHTVSLAQYKIPGKARKEYEKARDKMYEGKVEEAEKHVAKALSIHPPYAEALTVRCILNLDRQKLEAAVADCEKAVESDGAYGLGYFALGAAYNQTSRYDDALRVLDRGVSLSPMEWQGYFEMSKAYIGKGDYETALKSAHKAQTYIKAEYAPLYLVKGHIHLALKNYGEAMAELQLYLDKAPKDDARSAEVRATLDKVKAYTAGNTQ